MAFWSRIHRSKLKQLTHQFKNSYSQIHGSSLPSYSVSHTENYVTKKPNWVIHRNSTDLRTTVRFFAAPVQATSKKEDKSTSGTQLNDQIKAQVVRVVTEEGHYVVSRHEALARARELNLDLVLVQRRSDPPVCKIMDYHKERYKQQLKDKDRAKSKSEVSVRKGDCKEVRFKIHTEQKDLKMKADTVKRLMERGYRVKCTALGAEDQDLEGILSRLFDLIEDVSVVESGPRVEKTQAYVIVRHIKFGPSKKGGAKKLKVVGAMNPEVQDAAAAPLGVDYTSSIESPVQFEEVPNLSEDMPNENLKEDKTAWSVLDASDEFDEVFDFNDDVNGVTPVSAATHSPANTNVPDFMGGNTVPSSQQEPSLRTENRYKRSEPRNSFPTAKSMDYASPGARDSVRSEPQFLNQRRHSFPTEKSMDYASPGARDSVRSEPQFLNQRRQPPLDLNISPSVREIKPVPADASEFRNLKLPKNEMPKPELSRPGTSTTSAPNYGIFSAPKTNNPVKQAAVHRNKESNSSHFSHNPNLRGQARPGLEQDIWKPS